MHDRGSWNISVVGCGHVGLVTAAGLAKLGHHVTGIDCDETLIERLKWAELPFREPRLGQLLKSQMAAGRLQFTNSYDDGLASADAVFLCVSTPSTVTGAADLSNVRAAASSVAATLSRLRRRPYIVNKSTAPIGTGEMIAGLFERAFRDSGTPAPAVVSNPEFLREGHAVEDFLAPSRVIVGSEDGEAAEAVAGLFHLTQSPTLVTDLRSAEMIKYVSNAYLATRVSFANEVSRLCERLEIDADGVLAGAGMDPRIGTEFFAPGIGYGGSCLPKDVAALAHVGDSVGAAMRLLSAVQDVNNHQRKHVVNVLRSLMGGLEGCTVAAWGLTFKGGTDDIRESPAIDVVALLRNEGAQVRCYDPAFSYDQESVAGIELQASAEEACRGADALVVLTDWPQFRHVDLQKISRLMRGRTIFDGRNTLQRETAEAAGFTYVGIGRPLRPGLKRDERKLEAVR